MDGLDAVCRHPSEVEVRVVIDRRWGSVFGRLEVVSVP